jgi:hypothetical protein
MTPSMGELLPGTATGVLMNMLARSMVLLPWAKALSCASAAGVPSGAARGLKAA